METRYAEPPYLLRNWSPEEAQKQLLLFDIGPRLIKYAGHPPCSVLISRGTVCAIALTEEELNRGQTADVRLLDMLLRMRQAIAELSYSKFWWTFKMPVGDNTITLLAYKAVSTKPTICVATPEEY